MYKLLHSHYHKRYHGIYQHAKKLFVLDLALLFLAFVMLAGSVFLYFWKPSLTGLINLSISLGKERIKSGEEVRLTIDFTNKSKYKLNDVSLGLRLPEGFIVDTNKTSKEVFSADSTFISLKEIKAGASGQTELYGWFWTEPNKEVNFITNLSYKPENSNNREQKLSSFVANLPDSILGGELTMSTSTFPNASLKFTYTLKNSSNREISNIFITSNLDAKTINEKDAANITLPPNGTKTITGQIITPNKSGNFSFRITPQVLANNHSIPQSTSEQQFQIYAPQIISGAKLLQSFAYAEPNQIIPIEVSWENKSEFKLQNIVLHLTSNLVNVVDWKKTAKENSAEAETNGLFFDKNSRTSLSGGSQNGVDTFNVKIYLLPGFDVGQIEKANLEIYPVVKAQAFQVSGQEFRQEGVHISLPLATEVNFNNLEARYYTSDGDQLGRGPLPPTIGKTTKYWIFVKILNTTNPLDDAAFSTSLPEGVELTGKQSTSIGPQLSYNSADRTISWKYSALPANSQTGLYFEVHVTPKASQIGQNIPLTNDLYFSATDDFTNKKFNLSHSSLNNVLNPNDAGHSLGSKVVE